ncbi:MAG: acyltransferase, partial [Deltaproteobacteria bacterium]|nr:acyltransferase [Deltaproteobacteria bacterium]
MSESVDIEVRSTRLRELDSLRGIAACGVLFWHYSAHFHAKPLEGLFAGFYRSGFYAVDFFFVLSGLVLARAYGTEARRGRLAENIVKRIARMFPLHIATLVLVALGQWILTAVIEQRHFVVANNDLYHFLLNLGLAQFLGLQSGFSFNSPAWSISTEFYVNVAYLAVLASGRRIIPIATTILLASFVLILATGDGALAIVNMDRHPAAMLTRTAYGFFTGVLLYEVVFCRSHLWKPNTVYFDIGFAVSVAALLAGALGYLRFPPHVEMASVLVGFPLLIICTSQGRLFKRVLRLRPLTYLGDISYSIYL